jgi:hypothetical protein
MDRSSSPLPRAGGAINAYLPDGDVEVQFADLEAFTAWVSMARWDLYRT